MKMSMTGQMRMEQRMKLAPRMIQSMEVLQLPLLALQEKIEAELSSNPVLEQVPVTDEDGVNPADTEDADPADLAEKELVVKDDSDNLEDFQRLDSIGSVDGDYTDYMDRAESFQFRRRSGEVDKKLEALNNTAAFEKSLNENLIEQWSFVDVDGPVKNAGNMIIDYIDDKGYLTVRLEQLHNPDKHGFGMEELESALELVQKMEPAGVGARDIKECLLIQMAQLPNDMTFESRLIADHIDDLLANRLPQIAKEMDCPIERVNKAIARMSKLDTSPGLQVGRDNNHPITADVIVEADEKGTGYIISLKDTHIPNLRVNSFYSGMAKNRKIDDKTRQFLQQNIRSAQWLMEAIEQRRHTLLRVARAVVDHQTEFFDKGQLYLKPLPMATVADKVGVHIATVSRAVSGKYVQCSQGVLPLRGFFSGGVKDTNGKAHSWDAIRAELQNIVDNEDKTKPLSDDAIRKELEDVTNNNIARRTVAKYRKLLNIPAARYRKRY